MHWKTISFTPAKGKKDDLHEVCMLKYYKYQGETATCKGYDACMEAGPHLSLPQSKPYIELFPDQHM